jgi:hypothetical protein
MTFVKRTPEGKLQITRIDLDIVVYDAMEQAKNAKELEFIYDSFSSVLEIANEEMQEKFEEDL